MTLHLVYPPSGTVGHDAKLELVILPLTFVNAEAQSYSIIAVHGLNPRNRDDTAHAWDTWRTPSGPTSQLWLRDDLPGQIPPARIFLYEYNSTDAYGASQATFFDKANGLLGSVHIERVGVPISRPIIFVGHSMGGLLIKQALINARSDAWYQGIKDATYGLCFFATPHDGDEHTMVRLGRGLAKLAGDNVTEALKPGGMFAEAIAEQWRHQSGHYDCVSFWESMDEVVPRESTQIGLASDREAIVLLKATHDKVCKFGYSEDDQDNLEAVKSNLQGLCQRSLEKGESPVRLANDIAPTPWQGRTRDVERTMPQEDYYPPLPKNQSFTGRENILAELQNKIFVQAQCSRIAISGLGGVGKSQIALQLAHWVRENRPEVSVFWISAISNASFKHVLMDIAKQLSIPLNNDTGDLKQTMQRDLSANKARPWLLIVDGADDEEIFSASSSSDGFYDFLTENDDGLLLITTRSRDVAYSFASTDMIELEVMTPAEAMQLLDNSLQKKDIVQNHELEATELLDLLGYLPLAIVQAAAYLNQNRHLSIRGYVELFDKSTPDKMALMSQEFLGRGQRREPVMSTCLVSFTQISEVNLCAQELLAFISCIEPRAIHKAMLPVFDSEEATEHAFGTLCAYGLLSSREDGKVFDMHRLVHLAAISWIEGQGRLEEFLEIAAESLASVFPPGTFEHRKTWQQYLPHAMSLLLKAESCKGRSILTLLQNVSSCLLYDQMFGEAVDCFKMALVWLNRHDTEGGPEVDILRLATECELARVYLQNEQPKEAIETLDGVIRVQREIVPAEKHDWLSTEHEVARNYLDNEQIEEGLEILEGVVEVQRMTMPPMDHDWISPQYDPCDLFSDWQIKEGIELLERSIRASRETWPLYEHSWLSSGHERACAYLDNGQIKEAIEIFERALWFRRDILPAKDRARLLSEHELARGPIDDRRIKEDIETLESFVRVQRDILPAENHNRLSSEYVLARVYFNNRRIKEAIEIFEGIVRIERDTLPSGHRDRLCSQQALGHAYLEGESFEDAALVLQDVVNIQKNTLPPDDPSRVNSEEALRAALEKSRGISRMHDENNLASNLDD